MVANTNLVKIAIHNGLKHYMLAPLPRGKGAKKRAELGLSVSLSSHMLCTPAFRVSFAACSSLASHMTAYKCKELTHL